MYIKSKSTIFKSAISIITNHFKISIDKVVFNLSFVKYIIDLIQITNTVVFGHRPSNRKIFIEIDCVFGLLAKHCG